MEIWKDIKGFEGLYQVSSSGEVKSLGNGLSSDSRTKQIRILKQRIKPNGYKNVKLCKEGKSFHLLVHRLVCIHFNQNLNNKREVNHIDGNKLNNEYSNLEWCSSSENQKHAFRLGLQKVQKGADNKQSKPIHQFDLDWNLIKRWDSIKQIEREIGFFSFGIINCCKKQKRYKTAYGFKWEYANDTKNS